MGYLEQTLSKEWFNYSVFEYFLKNNPKDEIDCNRYNDLSQVASVLSKLKINSSLLESDQLIGTLSGGEKVKMQLAKLVVNNPDVLLLDEPTNDLDIKTLEWLENFISVSNIPIIYISHDETLLERTANIIIHLEQVKKKSNARHTIENMGYREYVEKRLGIIQKQEQVARKQRAEYQAQMAQWRQVYQKVDYQQETITRADPHGAKLLKKKMKSLKSQQRRLEKNADNFLDIPDVEEVINFDFDNNIYIPNGKIILDLHIPILKINDRILSQNIELKVNGPEHVVLIGKNGIGKTTLFKKIYEIMQDRKDINIGYMPQDYEELINPNITALEFLQEEGSKTEETKVRSFMGNMKFTSEEMLAKIENLSGGQKAKLLLLKMILNNCDVLLMDEPTRNLSPLSNPVIREVLANYKGAIISISHDRKFINEVCDIVYELNENGIKKTII